MLDFSFLNCGDVILISAASELIELLEQFAIANIRWINGEKATKLPTDSESIKFVYICRDVCLTNLTLACSTERFVPGVIKARSVCTVPEVLSAAKAYAQPEDPDFPEIDLSEFLNSEEFANG